MSSDFWRLHVSYYCKWTSNFIDCVVIEVNQMTHWILWHSIICSHCLGGPVISTVIDNGCPWAPRYILKCNASRYNVGYMYYYQGTLIFISFLGSSPYHLGGLQKFFTYPVPQFALVVLDLHVHHSAHSFGWGSTSPQPMCCFSVTWQQLCHDLRLYKCHSWLATVYVKILYSCAL